MPAVAKPRRRIERGRNGRAQLSPAGECVAALQQGDGEQDRVERFLRPARCVIEFAERAVELAEG